MATVTAVRLLQARTDDLEKTSTSVHSNLHDTNQRQEAALRAMQADMRSYVEEAVQSSLEDMRRQIAGHAEAMETASAECKDALAKCSEAKRQLVLQSGRIDGVNASLKDAMRPVHARYSPCYFVLTQQTVPFNP